MNMQSNKHNPKYHGNWICWEAEISVAKLLFSFRWTSNIIRRVIQTTIGCGCAVAEGIHTDNMLCEKNTLEEQFKMLFSFATDWLRNILFDYYGSHTDTITWFKTPCLPSAPIECTKKELSTKSETAFKWNKINIPNRKRFIFKCIFVNLN